MYDPATSIVRVLRGWNFHPLCLSIIFCMFYFSIVVFSMSVVTIFEFYWLYHEGGGMCYWCVTFLDAQMGLQCA